MGPVDPPPPPVKNKGFVQRELKRADFRLARYVAGVLVYNVVGCI